MIEPPSADYGQRNSTGSHRVTLAYAVPRRFGLGSLLAFTTLFAVLSGILRYYQAPVMAFVFFGVLWAVVCGAQMWSAQVPRLVSIIAGAVCLPAFVILDAIIRGWNIGDAIASGFCLMIPGGIAGYLTGAISAGVFLVADLVERRLRGLDIVEAKLADPLELSPDTPVYTPDSCAPYLGEEAAKFAGESTMSGESENAPRVKKLGPPEGVPVYNCMALVSPRDANGTVHVRAANIADLRTSGATEREALQHLVGAFKIIVSQCLAEGRPVPLLAEPQLPQPGEQQRFIAVHL